jgi:hypothetical protein
LGMWGTGLGDAQPNSTPQNRALPSEGPTPQRDEDLSTGQPRATAPHAERVNGECHEGRGRRAVLRVKSHNVLFLGTNSFN